MNQPATRDDVNRLGTAVEALADSARVAGEQQAAAIRDFLEAYRPPGPVQQMHFQPPPPARAALALWVSVTCNIVMLTAMIPMAAGLYWVAMDSRDRGYQMSALYMSVPGLRDLVDTQLQLIEKTKRQPAEGTK